MAPLTRAQAEAALQHIFVNVLQGGSDSPLAKALDEHGTIKTPNDLAALSLAEIDSLAFKDDQNNMVPLAMGYRYRIKAFRYYVQDRHTNGNPIEDSEWATLSPEEFQNFRISPHCAYMLDNPSIKHGQPTGSLSSGSNSSRARDPVADFEKGIKHDQVNLHDFRLGSEGVVDDTPQETESHEESTQKDTMGQARAQNVDDYTAIPTKVLPANALEHIFSNVLNGGSNSDMAKAIEHHGGVTTPDDLVGLSLTEIDGLKLRDVDNYLVSLNMGYRRRIKEFKCFVLDRRNNGNPIRGDDWIKLTYDEYAAFRMSLACPDMVESITAMEATKSTSNSSREHSYDQDPAIGHTRMKSYAMEKDLAVESDVRYWSGDLESHTHDKSTHHPPIPLEVHVHDRRARHPPDPTRHPP